MLPGTANTVELPGIHPLRNVKHVKLAPIPYLLALKFLWGIPTTTRSKLPLHSDPLLIASSNSGPTPGQPPCLPTRLTPDPQVEPQSSLAFGWSTFSASLTPTFLAIPTLLIKHPFYWG